MARWAYKKNQTPSKEESLETVVWALVWSALFIQAFNTFGHPVDKAFFGKDKPDSYYQGIGLLANVGAAFVIGWLFGRIGLTTSTIQQERTLGRLRGFWKTIGNWLLKFFSFKSEKPRRSHMDVFLNKEVRNRYVRVTLKDGTELIGYVQRNDAHHKDAYSITLGHARPIDKVTGKEDQTRPLETLFLHSGEITAIKVYDEHP